MAVRYLITIGVLIYMITFAWLFWQKYLDLSRELSAAKAQIEGYEEAARIHRNYVEKLRGQTEEWSTLNDELMELDGKDAPLSDYLSTSAGRVWP